MTSYYAGLISETVACIYLRLHGFRILRRRYTTGHHTGLADIDIIARRKNLLVFIEVKYRPNIATGLNAIPPSQAMRLRRAAETYITQTHWMNDARFDMIVITPCTIKWIRGAI